MLNGVLTVGKVQSIKPTRNLPVVQNKNLPHEKPKPTTELLEALEKERMREREQMQATIDDLRKRLDEEAEERRKLTKLLTHQTEPVEKKKENLLFKKIFKK